MTTPGKFGQLPKFERPKFEFPTVEVPKVELPKIDLRNFDPSAFGPERVIEVAKDAAFITIGLGVLAFQRAQVRRQEMTKSMSGRLNSLEASYTDLEERLDDLVDDVAKKLPEPTAGFVAEVHRTAKIGRRQVVSLLGVD